jgi:hypothetical protein
VTTILERIAFLQKLHLFGDLSEGDLNYVAQALVDEPFKAGDRIIEQGTRGDTFYMIYRGRVKVVRQRNNGEQVLANLVQQDFFGEEELFVGGVRAASIIATTEGSVLVLNRSKLDELLKRAPKLKTNFDVVIATHRLWRKLQFKWVRPDEAVYFLARKHPILLWRALVGPVFALLVPALFMVWGVFIGDTWPFALGAVIVLLIAGWAVWLVVDWGNDYYVVTNQRVVWVEKVIGFFDSRQEAPLSTVLSVGSEIDTLGRILDFGHVIVRTFVGKIAFNHVSHPRHAAHLVEEYWGRTKEQVLSAEKDAMKDALRRRLNIPIPAKPDAPAPETQTFPKLRRPNVFKLFWLNIFRLRLEDGDTVTYRKHGFVLFQQIWLPSLFLLTLFSGWLVRIFYLIVHPLEVLFTVQPNVGLVVDSVVLSIPVLSIPFWIWWLYQYVDWTNDIFQVTPDQIIDIDKTPFGTEERRAAPLENILSTEYQRIGFLGNIFNFGTVYITVGGSKLEFQDVYDPAMVQSDIDRRRMARVAAKNATAAAADRERIAEWLVTYHRNADEFRRIEGEQGNQPPKPE